MTPEIKAKVELAAEATGLSISAFVEQLIAHVELDDAHLPAWWTNMTCREQEELPLTQAS